MSLVREHLLGPSIILLVRLKANSEIIVKAGTFITSFANMDKMG
jgi:hypothetical protein